MKTNRPEKRTPGNISPWKRFRFWLHLLCRRGQKDDTRPGDPGEKK